MSEKYYVTDSELSERFPLYTRANVGEVFPDPVTPLTGSGIMFHSEIAWREAWERIGAFQMAEFPADEMAQLGIVGGYCYLNASIIRLFGERAPGLTWKDMDEQFFGAQPGIPPYVAVDGDEDPAATEKIGGTFGWALSLTKIEDINELTEDRNDTRQLRANRPDYSAMTDDEIWQLYANAAPGHRRYFSHHIFTTYMATVPVGIISAVATAVGRTDLIMPIIAGIGQVDSAEPSHAMWDLGRSAASSAEVAAAFDAGVHGMLNRLRASDAADVAAWLEQFEAFLYEFGSRGPNEWESRSNSWETHPELALSAIDRMRISPAKLVPGLQFEARATERATVSDILLAMVEGNAETHGQLSAAIASSAAWLPGRERTKTNNIRFIHELRVALRELGRRMVEAGGFDEIEDFAMVQEKEWPALLAAPTSMLDIVRQRRAEYDDLLTREPPFIFDGHPDSPAAWRVKGEDVPDKLVAGDTLQGMPGCPGSAEGRARVILDSHDPLALQPGDILIAPITDPSWTPLFVPSGAVVVDVGAALSHAIIVSRELGIPCVISATQATEKIPDGAMIKVNGDTGVVTILSLE
jgi:phosphohistidine swiveling domain-containing protein